MCANIRKVGALVLGRLVSLMWLFLSKLGWRITSESKPLWIQVLKRKYLRSHNFKDWPSNKKASHTWRSIIKVRDFTMKNIKWIVGDGNTISFWHDWWCGDTSLAENGQAAPTGEHFKVKDFINEDNTWNTQLISQTVGESNVNIVTNTLLPRRAEVKDMPCWVPSNNGVFSVKSGYDKLAGSITTDTSWGWIWKLKVPDKLQGFLWTCLYGKLLTNQHRKLRGLTENDQCPRCGSGTEDLLHLFFVCPSSADIWSRLPQIQVLASGDLEDWRIWLEANIKQTRGSPGGSLNSVLKLVITWNIWKMRNKKVFDDTNPNPLGVLLESTEFTTEIVNLYHPLCAPNPKQLTLVSWNFPGSGKMMMNTDGSSRGNPGKAGFGGVIRDDRGCWVMGFYGKLKDCTSLEAELWGIFKGLELVQSQGMEEIEINSDSTAAISLINEDASAHSPHGILIQECKALMALTGCSLKHIYRDGNQVADKLANLGVDQEHNWVSHISPPEDIIPLLEAYMRGVAYERM